MRVLILPMDVHPQSMDPVASVHPTALVAAGAVLGEGASVGPWCSVGPEVTLGRGVRLLSHVVVDGRTVIGDDTIIYPFSTIGLPPQDLKYRGEPTETRIGARTQIREHCTIHRGTVTGTGITAVGDDCLLMAVVHVAHDCTLGTGVIVANNVVMGGHVTIGDHAVIGGASAIHQFVRIGRGSMVGGVSGVEADVVPFGAVLGNRARLCGINIVGLKRRGVERAELHRFRTAFRSLFLANESSFADRVAALRDSHPDGFVHDMLEFVQAPSRRGLVRSALRRDDDDDGGG